MELRLDGKQVAEVDISASYLTIFYVCHGEQIDPATACTDVIGPGELHRAIVKTWVNTSFGNSGLLTKWSPGVKNDFAKRNRKQQWTIDGKKYPVRLVREAALARHPLLKEWGQPRQGKPQDYGDLMYRESVSKINPSSCPRAQGVPGPGDGSWGSLPSDAVEEATKQTLICLL